MFFPVREWGKYCYLSQRGRWDADPKPETQSPIDVTAVAAFALSLPPHQARCLDCLVILLPSLVWRLHSSNSQAQNSIKAQIPHLTPSLQATHHSNMSNEGNENASGGKLTPRFHSLSHSPTHLNAALRTSPPHRHR